jgi:hypothetical protein
MTRLRWRFALLIGFVGLLALTGAATAEQIPADTVGEQATQDTRPDTQIDTPGGITASNGPQTVVIRSTAGNGSQAVAAVEATGSVDYRVGREIQASITPSAISDLANDPAIASIRPLGRQLQPSTQPQTTGPLNLTDLHRANLTGRNATVAILDSGFNRSHPAIRGHVADSKDFTTAPGDDTTHGTAVAEIVTATAPEVELVLIEESSVTEFKQAAGWLTEQNDIDVAVASTSFVGVRLDGDGELTGAIHNDTDTLWVAAAGNYGNGTHWHDSQATSQRSEAVEFGGSLSTGCNVIETKQPFRVFAQWDGWDKSTPNDYDLTVFEYDAATDSLDLLRQGNADQTAGAAPYEIVTIPGRDRETTYCVSLTNWDADGYNRFDLWLEGAGVRFEQSTSAESVTPPAASDAVVGVGALSDGTVAAYSSRGPSVAGYRKPNLVAPAGVESSVYEEPFAGTSAAAPFVAGTAAIYAGKYAAIEPATIRDDLTDSTDPTARYTTNELPNNIAGDGQLNASRMVKVPNLTVSTIEFIETQPGQYDLVLYLTDLSPDGRPDVVSVDLPSGANLTAVNDVSSTTIPTDGFYADTDKNRISVSMNPTTIYQTDTQLTIKMTVSGINVRR